MCGIWAFLQAKEPTWNYSRRIGPAIDTLKARGPDTFQRNTFKSEDGVFTVQTAFARLAINDLSDAGNQPFVKDTLAWICNGEIYNHKEYSYFCKSASDCECLGDLWYNQYHLNTFEQNVNQFTQKLKGVFACIFIDTKNKELVAIRDRFGIRPLYYMVSNNGVFLGSERKSLEPLCDMDDMIYEFPPGTAIRWKLGDTLSDLYESRYQYFTLQPHNTISDDSDTNDMDLDYYIVNLEQQLLKAVELRMISDRPVAALLSGGLDSSVIAGLVQRNLMMQGQPPLKTFSIGMAGSKDLEFAKMASDWMRSDHTEIIVTPDEMFNCIPDVIRDIESYDITTVRASVGNWMVSREIARRSDCKVVFNGDGSDELFGSYLYFFRAETNKEYSDEVLRLLKNIHRYDVLRSDRSVSSHGLEARTPYLDSDLVNSVMLMPTSALRPLQRKRMEKFILRQVALRQKVCPPEVALRRKEAFSDGVSGIEKTWYEIIQEKIKEKKLVPENWRDLLVGLPDWVKPQTEEAFYYYSIYCKLYPHTGDPWPYWMPQWSPETSDPSARTLALY